MSKSIYREALNEVSKRVSDLRLKDKSKVVSFAAECNNYAAELGFKKWNLLAKEFKEEDAAKGICWNCADLDDSIIRVCVECGRKGNSKSDEFKIRHTKNH